MEGNFRNALIIISAIVIGAIFVHGLWTIRKNKNPYKLKTKKDTVKPLQRGFDHSGFDQDGVSKKRLLSSSDDPNDTALANKAESISVTEVPNNEFPNIEESSIENGFSGTVPSKQAPDISINESAEFEIDTLEPVEVSEILQSDTMFEETEFAVEMEAGDKGEFVLQETKTPEVKRPVYEEPVTRPKPQIAVKAKKSAGGVASAGKTVPITKKKPLTKSELKRDQMEINFGAESGLDKVGSDAGGIEDKSIPAFSAIDEEPVKKPKVDPEVIVLSVVMPENQIMSGAALLPSLLTLGMKYGDMNIFHRHQDNAGNGKVTFSLANMMNPGTFDLDSMETFATQGVSLFMTLPNVGDPFEVFEQMLSAAKQLAHEFHGQLLDDKRSMMTKQTEQHYIGKIRDFERRNRIMSV